jgi:hypothetical protein
MHDVGRFGVENVGLRLEVVSGSFLGLAIVVVLAEEMLG